MTDDLAERMAAYEERGVRHAMLGLADIDGVLRGKFVGLAKLKSLLAKGGGFCDCVFGWDVNDQLYDGGAVTGWHSGFPDALYRLITATERAVPGDGTPYFIGEFAARDEGEHPVCPRSLLRRVLHRCGDLGYAVKAGFEYELFVFDEDADSVREKGYRDLAPLTPGNFGYSVLRAAS
ncbi:MAG: glutamine synthetase, partial [Gammaproteobacteria bacterium]|nr:glutamine synthetase [Gammaproteobacteria bacterium]